MVAITILGGGGWGTAFSVLLAEKGHLVTLWVRRSSTVEVLRRERTNERHLPGVTLPAEVHITSSFAGMSLAEYFLWATPSTALSEIGRMLLESKQFGENSVMVSCVKGLDHQRYRRMTEILEEIFPELPTAVLSGPNHAEEVSRSIPSATVMGDNSKAALVTRSLAELTRIGIALGGRRETFQGLSGIGDLVGTCFSRHSRNRRVGERVAKGEHLNQIIESMGTVAEGIPTTRSAFHLGERLGVATPIIREVHSILYESASPAEAMQRLLARELRPEED
jgi:glycerol-3-phosphate dehydrogenase (NAD(P)+)